MFAPRHELARAIDTVTLRIEHAERQRRQRGAQNQKRSETQQATADASLNGELVVFFMVSDHSRIGNKR